MKRLILVACACAAGVAVASDYAWQGGVSGAWNTDSNWNPNGVPGAGDTATFSVDAEITDDFADVRIVQPEAAKPWEKTAAEELRSHLKRIVPSGRISSTPEIS